MVVSELRGEKIDIIPWNQEPARFVAKALSPARVREVYLDDAGKEATVVVPDDQLALAIGKEGMNARLAHRLTGWKIDIVSDTEFAQQEAEAAFGGDGGEEGDFSGRCSAMLSNGKRCPNAALPGLEVLRRPGPPGRSRCTSPTTRRTRSSRSPSPSSRRSPTLSEPEAVTEDAAEFGNPEPEEFPAGPGDAPVDGADQTLESGGVTPRHGSRTTRTSGVPILHVTAEEAEIEGVGEDGEPRSGPARAAAARRRRRSSSASTRADGVLAPGAGPGPGRLHVPAAAVLRARERASRLSTEHCGGPSASTLRSRGSTLEGASWQTAEPR